MIYKPFQGLTYSGEYKKSLKPPPFKTGLIHFFQQHSHPPVAYQVTKSFFHEAWESSCLVHHLMKMWQISLIKEHRVLQCMSVFPEQSVFYRPRAAARECSGTPATEKLPHIPHPQFCCHSTFPSLLTPLKEKLQTKPWEPGEDTYPSQSGKAYVC